jgi:phage baseplate assembly protein W
MATDFGRDTSCTTGRRTGRIVTGPRLVAEAIFRRLTTPRGRLRGGKGEQNYGMDLTDLIGQATSKARVAAMGGQIATEVEKDDRILSADVSVVATDIGPGVELTITVRSTLKSGGTFELVLGVSEVTVTLLGVSP